MPPKKKGKKGKKAKKGKAKVEVEEERTEHDNMDLEMLREVVPMLKQQLEKQMLDRNYVQLERDTIQSFSDISREEAMDLGSRIAAREKAMQQAEDNHRMEVRVYLQKVKHLEYEHAKNLRTVQEETQEMAEEEAHAHSIRGDNLHTGKKVLKLQLVEQDLVHADEIKTTKEMHERNLRMMRKIFEKNNAELEDRQARRLKELKHDLRLRRKAHIHEIEERKNQHINDLMENHERAFRQMKDYYNDITNDNIKLIKSLKQQVSEMKKRQIANQKLMRDIALENQRLKEPLNLTLSKVTELKTQLRDRDKDKLSLRHALARLVKLKSQHGDLTAEHAQLRTEHRQVAADRDEVYRHFEDAIVKVQEQSEIRNAVLQERIRGASGECQNLSSQIDHVAKAANLQPAQVETLSQSVEEALRARNSMIQDLRAELFRASKEFNDSLKSLEAVMFRLGVPPNDSLRSMGFREFDMLNATPSSKA